MTVALFFSPQPLTWWGGRDGKTSKEGRPAEWTKPYLKTTEPSAYTALSVLTPSSKSAGLPTSADGNARIPRFDDDNQSIPFPWELASAWNHTPPWSRNEKHRRSLIPPGETGCHMANQTFDKRRFGRFKLLTIIHEIQER